MNSQEIFSMIILSLLALALLFLGGKTAVSIWRSRPRHSNVTHNGEAIVLPNWMTESLFKDIANRLRKAPGSKVWENTEFQIVVTIPGNLWHGQNKIGPIIETTLSTAQDVVNFIAQKTNPPDERRTSCNPG